MKRSVIAALLILMISGMVYSQGFDFPGFPGMPGGGSDAGSNKARDRADDAMDKMQGLIPMRFFSAINRNPIPSATIEIPNVGTFVTNNQGKISFPRIPDGTYTLTFSKDGFITTPIDFRVLLGGVDFNWYSISPVMPAPPPPRPAQTTANQIIPDRNYRIVLEWGERPADLDIHFVKSGGSGAYHISYFNMRTADDGNATLDRDDTNGYGPETITIGRVEQNAVYTCYVQDYTNRNNTSSTQMAQNGGAVIRVYSQNRLVNTFNIPANAPGVVWNVFRIERGEVITVNTVTAAVR
uniref:Carboxypeptidase regulatory-like domain-containing protein n=1 Tax=uncultured bacterium contig00086 TaxID=1181559 RepID=A0A806KGC8_9BACT|nr:hypothetical protein [uncultured bacterium contig00086]